MAIVIVTYNSAHVIDSLLDSLATGLGDVSAEVIVVDNGSHDGTVQRLQARGGTTVIESTNGGYSAGINRGVAAAPDAPAILVLNPDTRLHPDAVGAMLEAVRRPGVGIVAPKILSADGSTYHSLRREPTLLRALGLNRTRWQVFSEYVNTDAEYDYGHVVDWALGAALLISRRCLDEVGTWDESFFLYSEETEFSLRARDRSFLTWYEPRAVIVHIGAQSGQNDTTHAMQILNRVRLYRRRHPAPLAYAYFVLTILSETTWVLRGHRHSRFAIRALLRPAIRPAQLGASAKLVPR